MLLLAIDTATVTVSVALHDGAEVRAELRTDESMSHGELLTPTIARVLADAGVSPDELTDVVVGVGPGPYTGLRVGVVTALTLGYTLGVATHGVCSNDPLGLQVAEECRPDSEFVAAIDARRKEIYWARFDASGRRIGEPQVAKPNVVAALGLPVFGRGGYLHASDLDWREGPLDPSAGVMASLVAAGQAVELPLEPLYLRIPDAVPQSVVSVAGKA